MKWVLIIIAAIILWPITKRILGFALKILTWVLWPIVIVLIFGAIYCFVKGMIAAGIVLIILSGILGGIIFIPDWFDYFD